MQGVFISKSKIQKDGGVTVLSLKEYNTLLERSVPDLYLTGKVAREVDKLVKGSDIDHKAGRIKILHSLDVY